MARLHPARFSPVRMSLTSDLRRGLMTRQFIVHRFVLFLSLAVLVSLTGCTPCGCSEATLDDEIVRILDGGLTGAHLHFESPLIGQNKFSLQLAYADRPPFVINGPYASSGDTITFQPLGATGLGIVRGTRYNVTCQTDPKRITIEINGTKLTFIKR
jgi:hypothetical protein